MHDKIIDYIENKEGDNFKQTEIGLIPKSWEVVRLGDVAEKLNAGGTPKTTVKEYWNGNIPFVKIGDITATQKYLKKTKTTITEDGLKNSSAWLIPENSILLSMYASIGEVAISKIPLATNQAILAIIPQKGFDVEFSFYCLKHYGKTLYSFIVQTTQKNVNKGITENLLIPLPSLPEQRKIARVLSNIQQAIEQQYKIIEATKNLKKSLMHKLFTEGIINGFMFDTVIFNKILDAEISLDSLPKNFKTHIQYDELNKTPNEDRRKKLLDIFFKIYSEEISTESTLLGTSILGKSKLSNNSLCEKIKLMLDRKQNKESNKNDALIAETSIKNGLILVTDDSDLLEVTQKYNGEVITLKDFLSGNYRKLKKTEIGQTPQIWEVVKIENIIDEIISGDWGIDEKENKEGFLKCRVIRGTDFLNLEKRIFSGVPRRLIKESSFKKKELKSGDLLIEISGGSKKQPTGRVFYINNYLIEKSSVPLLFTNFVKLIRVKEETILSEYLWHYWQYLYDKGITRIYEKRTTGIRNFKYKDFLFNEIIPIPPLYEQQQIVNIINTVDKKIELEESRKSILKELFKTMLHKLMTGEIRLKDIEV